MKPGRSYTGITLDFDRDNLYEVKLPLNKQGIAEVMFLGDLHIGHTQFAASHLERYINVLKNNPQLRVIMMGDYFECGDFASDSMIEDQTIRFKEQVQTFLSYFKPVANQIICMLYGNHEERVIRNRKILEVLSMFDKDILGLITEKLGNPKIITGKPQEGMILCLRVGPQVYPIYVHHSSTGAIANQFTQLKRTSFNWALPLLAHGHVHRKGWQDHTYFTVTDVDGVLQREVVRQYWLLTGCFLREAAYAESKSYPVPDVGAPIVKFYSDMSEMDYVDTRTQKEYHKYFIKAGGLADLRVPIDMSWYPVHVKQKKEVEFCHL